jgi:hypothetical protein
MTSPPVPSNGPTERRRVASDDPSLSPEANQMLTDELCAILGSAFVDVPIGRADPAHARHGTHSEGVADLIADRFGYVAATLVLVVVLAIVGLSSGSVVALAGALVVLGVSLALVVLMITRLAGEGEHPSPELAALLEREGVGDPDRLLTDLVREFSAGDR